MTRLAFGAVLFCSTACWAQSADAPGSVAEFRHAYDAAMANAKGHDGLDPAYELLGVAGNAKERGLNDLAENAAAAFADLVHRASAAALHKGGSATQDTLDQLVDLRFFAETTHLSAAITALDGEMSALFPAVATAIVQRADASTAWDDKISGARDLAGLQASATQVLLADMSKTVADAFAAQITKLSAQAATETDDAERARKSADVEELKRSRDEQVSDAANNNVTSIAKQMQSSGRESVSSSLLHSEAGADLPAELVEGEGSCIETGYVAASARPSDSDVRRLHDRDCVNSGRVPSTARCTTANLSFVCYGHAQGGEKITYIYHDTPAETYFRKSCAVDDTVPAAKLPKTGVGFRTPDIKLVLICAPAGSDTAAD